MAGFTNGKGTGNVGTQVNLNAADFRKYDMKNIDDRAQAVRDILAACGLTKENDGKWTQHLIDGYSLLAQFDFVESDLRTMTSEELEQFHIGTYKAVSAAASLTDFVSLLHPMLSVRNPTLATDKWYRISVGWWFFDPDLRASERGTMIVHEVMHGVLGHYELPRLEPEKVNKAGDAVINQGIEHSRSQFMHLPENPDKSDMFIFPRNIITRAYPHGMKDHDSFMAYYQAYAEEEQQQSGCSGQQNTDSENSESNGNNSQNSSSGQQGGNQQNNQSGNSGITVTMNYEDGSSRSFTGNARPCTEMDNQDAQDMDSQGIEKAGELEKEMARAGATTKAMEAIKSRGSTGSGFDQFVLDALLPPKVKWETYLKTIMARQFNAIISGNTDYSYRRPNRRSDPNGFIRPSMIAYAPTVSVGCDTSGSMGEKDYMEALGEIESLCKTLHCVRLEFVTVDTQITSEQVVRNAKDIKLGSGGGTDMAPFFNFINEKPERKKPDLAILCTDGCLSDAGWQEAIDAMDKTRKNIILITDPEGMREVQPYLNTQNLTVLPIY